MQISALESGFEICQVWVIDEDKRPIPDAGAPAGGDNASGRLSFRHMDFSEAPRPESTGGLTGCQSINHRVYAGAGMGDELEAGGWRVEVGKGHRRLNAQFA